MTKRGLLVVMLIFMLPLAMALETPIKVKTLEFYDVSIYVLDPDQVYYLLESFHKNSVNKGEVDVVSTVNEPEVKIKVIVKKDGEIIISREFKDKITGQPIVLEVYPNGYVPPNKTEEDVNSTNNETNSTNNETLAENNAPVQSNQTEKSAQVGGITGESIVESKSYSKNIFWIGSLIIALVGVASFILGRRISLFPAAQAPQAPQFSFQSQKSQPQSPPPIKQIPEQQKPAFIQSRPNSLPSESDSLTYAEEKIKEAQSEINKIRSKEKITALERKIAKDKAELDRLKKTSA